MSIIILILVGEILCSVLLIIGITPRLQYKSLQDVCRPLRFCCLHKGAITRTDELFALDFAGEFRFVTLRNIVAELVRRI